MQTENRKCAVALKNMINRTLVRTKVVKSVFAYYNDTELGITTLEKHLLRSFSDVYNLYFLQLELVNYLTSYADERLSEAKERAQAMHADFNANPRFINNRFAQQLFENKMLRHYVNESKLSWESAHDSVSSLYKQITDSKLYKDYMASSESSYEADKTVWRKIFAQLLAGNPQLESALEELEITLDASDWAADMDIVMSFVVKTIRRFREDSDADQPLLEMFDTEDEVSFAKTLLKSTIKNTENYEKMVADCLKNWDPERIAFMDRVILNVALAELFNFPDIPVQVTLNEYLDIAREYSTENSPQFINGVLDEVIKRQRKTNPATKFLTLK